MDARARVIPMILVWQQEKVERLVYWMQERERIRIRKERGDPPPWTDDPILREWRFCNLDRMDDRVSRWVHQYVVALYRDDPALWHALVVARLVNWPPTLLHWRLVNGGVTWDAGRFVDLLETLARRGEKVFTSAYVVPAGPRGIPKARHLAAAVLSPLWDARGEFPRPREGTCALWADLLSCVSGLGPFLANQVVADLKYTPYLDRAPDRGTFALAGPGTRRGLNRLLGRPLEAAWSQADAGAALLDLRLRVVPLAPELGEKLGEMNNLSNVACELDKYERVRLGEGKPRQRYVPSSEPMP